MAKRRKSSGAIARPVTAHNREMGVTLDAPRRFIDVRNRYDGAATGRRMGSWNAPNTGPNRAIAQLQTLRNRARDAVRNEWQAAGAVRVKVANIIGTGITPRPKTKNQTLKERLNKLWNDWVKSADADGLLDYYGQQSLAARCRYEAGEVFVRARVRRIDSNFRVPFQIQLLEPEMCPLLDSDTWPGMPPRNKMRQGIEFDYMGQRVAYWFYKEHPSDFASGNVGTDQLIRVSAEFVKHIFKPVRIGQIRGVPEGATNLAKLRVVTDFDDAVLARQHTANLFTGFLTKTAPTADGIDSVTGKAIEYDSDGAPMASLEPGTMQELLPGENVTFANPPEAGTNYADYMRWQTLGLSSGDGIPYELLTGDLRDVSDRTLRVILNEFHRMCEQEQWNIIIPGLCAWVRDQWVKYYLLAGLLKVSEAEDAADVTWSPQAFAWVHPTQDVQALQAQVDGGFKSRSAIIAERGDDPVEVDAERAEEQAREIELGLAFEPVDPNEPVEADPAEKAQVEKSEAETKKVKAQEALILAQADRERAVGNAEAARLTAQASLFRAEADLAESKVVLHTAELSLVEARCASEKAEADARLADLAAAEARASAESDAHIASLEEVAALAREDAARKAEAHKESEAFAVRQREIVLDAEQKRREIASLELKAAQLGLAELSA